MSTETISEAFDLIRQYAEREGWIPIGWRDWRVGPWRIRVNGTRQEREQAPPWHALIEHDTMVAFMCIHPMGGSVGGWKDTEADFINAMKAELEQEAAVRPSEGQ
jgi:hypothetical protein